MELRRAALAAILALGVGCMQSSTTFTPASTTPAAITPEAQPALPGPDPAATDPAVFFFEPFESPAFLARFHETNRVQNFLLTTATRALGDASLRVRYPRGSNYGGSLRYRFASAGLAEPEELYGRYYLKFADNFLPGSGGKLPGPAGTYGRAGWGGRANDGTNGWSARMGFTRSQVDPEQLQLHYYAYHVDSGTYGEFLYWDIESRGSLEKERWYCIETYVRLNTPGAYDGVLRGWVDGALACEFTDVRFRDTADLKIEEFWINHYFGGVNPVTRDQDVFMDNFALSFERIGAAR